MAYLSVYTIMIFFFYTCEESAVLFLSMFISVLFLMDGLYIFSFSYYSWQIVSILLRFLQDCTLPRTTRTADYLYGLRDYPVSRDCPGWHPLLEYTASFHYLPQYPPTMAKYTRIGVGFCGRFFYCLTNDIGRSFEILGPYLIRLYPLLCWPSNRPLSK